MQSCQRGHGGQAQQQSPVCRCCADGGAHRYQREPQWQPQVAVPLECWQSLLAPAPRCPDSQGPAGRLPRHSSNRARLAHSLPLTLHPVWLFFSRQRHGSSCHAISAAAATRNQSCRNPSALVGNVHTGTAPYQPGAAQAQHGRQGRGTRQGQPGQPGRPAPGGATVTGSPARQNPKNTSGAARLHQVAVVASCDSWANPRQASRASSPPSAMARA